MLIGPPASGKSTTAQELAAQLQALVLSTDVLREELWGDAAIQGPWPVLERVLHSRIQESVEAGRPVLIDATHARRRWRRRLPRGPAGSDPPGPRGNSAQSGNR